MKATIHEAISLINGESTWYNRTEMGFMGSLDVKHCAIAQIKISLQVAINEGDCRAEITLGIIEKVLKSSC